MQNTNNNRLHVCSITELDTDIPGTDPVIQGKRWDPSWQADPNFPLDPKKYTGRDAISIAYRQEDDILCDMSASESVLNERRDEVVLKLVFIRLSRFQSRSKTTIDAITGCTNRLR